MNHPSAGYQHFNYASNAISTCKYDILSFLPRFLQEQFRRYSNVFFLIIVLLQQIPDVSPTGRFTTAVPFIIILTASALKEIFEDIKRSRSDKEINNFETKILENGQWKKTKWKKVVVGSIVRIENDEFFPADLLLLSSSEKYALSYIETSNLDGETNLKIKQGLECTSEKTEIEQLSELTCEICCEQPNKNVNQFIGTLYIGAASYPLSINQILLRGARLKNTSFVNGIVLYTGHEAKLLMNSTTAPLKQSNIDIMVNGRILILFVMLVILSVISAFGSLYYEHFLLSGAYYLGFTRVSFSFLGLTKTYMYNLLTFFILYNNLIPISLQFTLEVVRFCQAYFISCDIEMYDERTDTVAVARTSNLNEELGQIKFVMCDKTGTLTRNVMKFKRCSIAGKGYGDDEADEFADFRLIADIDNQKCGDYILEFLRVMSLCHTVVAELDNENIVYRSSSPDEGALVRGAANLGFVYEMKTPSSIKIKERDVLREYVILNVLNFSSERKRMSVIVRCPDGEIKLYIKGADSVIFSRLSQESLFKDECLSHLKEYANKGYRTLCFAYRQLNEEFYGKWAKKFAEASVAIEGREYLIDKCASEIEVELLLIGVSAIEDKLQEGVPETIQSFVDAGIHVWMLTGDKRETAINIGYASNLCAQGTKELLLDGRTYEETFDKLKSLNSVSQLQKNLLIVDGTALYHALSGECREKFLSLSRRCHAVICCRMSPLQKAEVVKVARGNNENVVLAVGDGANDVAMIRMANVGVGISGEEGLQAATSSDYSIAQFRFLKRLIFVHGVWNLERSVKVILYSFYKNICLYLIELWFAFYSAFSGETVFERWTIALFNVVFTAFPPIVLGLFDRPLSDVALSSNAQKYTSVRKNAFGNSRFMEWLLFAILHSILLYFFSHFLLLNPVSWKNGRTGGWLMFGNCCYTFVVITVSLKALSESESWTSLLLISSFGSIVLWLFFFLIYSVVWNVLPFGADICGLAFIVMTSLRFWFACLIVPVATLLFDLLWKH